MRPIFYMCGLVAAILMFSPASARAQTTAVGPYYATPSWDQTLPCTTLANCPRFVVLANFNNAAVLDRETGLVWERSPSAAVVNQYDACMTKVVANRQGWRLPTFSELGSLIDRTQNFPSLPAGHPFIVTIDTSDSYWTATPTMPVTGGFYIVNFSFPDNAFGAFPDLGSKERAWCVRGNGN